MSTITNNMTVQEWAILYDTFKTEKNPDTDALQRFLDAPYIKTSTTPDRDAYHHDYMNALRLKLEALTREPSPMEKTMTRLQLYVTDSPLWTNDMTSRDIIEIIDAVHWLKSYGNDRQILNIFDNIINMNGNVNYVKLNKLFR